MTALGVYIYHLVLGQKKKNIPLFFAIESLLKLLYIGLSC